MFDNKERISLSAKIGHFSRHLLVKNHEPNHDIAS